jgi:hypothetical protein
LGRAGAVLASGSLVAGVMAGVVAVGLSPAPVGTAAEAAPGDASPPSLPSPGDTRDLFEVTGPRGLAGELRQRSYDVTGQRISGDGETVQLVLSREQHEQLSAGRHVVRPVRNVHGHTQLEAAEEQALGGYRVWRRYTGPGGIAQRLHRIAAEHPGIAEVVEIGRSAGGTHVLALRLTKGGDTVPHGRRPAVLYSALLHGRDWIGGEVAMRLLEHVTDRYRDEDAIRHVVDTTELWFVPVANPDGYGLTFVPGQRLWRKNLRDVDRDGRLTERDGVDLDRNFATKFGYDDEGSSGDPVSPLYRGPAAGSEPETAALDRLLRRTGFAFAVDFQAYGSRVLRPAGWQTETELADDPVYDALDGGLDAQARPVIKGFTTGRSSQPEIVNGGFADHAHAAYGTLAWTVQLGEGCRGCGFVFPDDDSLVQQAFKQTLTFSLGVAGAAANPADPAGHRGEATPDFVIDPFPVSYGSKQPVQVTAKRRLGEVVLRYSVGGGPAQRAPTTPWSGGERYGDGYDAHYHRLRGLVTGVRPGDEVRVWFEAPTTGAQSEAFTYRMRIDVGGDLLVIAAEDVGGVLPTQQRATAAYAEVYTDALAAAGHSSDVYDVDQNGRRAPHPLGVLSHYRTVVWETGDDVVPRLPGQPTGTAARLALDLEQAARDYLNEGGRLLLAGSFAGFAQGQDGAYYYGPRGSECMSMKPPCLPIGDDFLQYYLGVAEFIPRGGAKLLGTPSSVVGTFGSFSGLRLAFADEQKGEGSTAAFIPMTGAGTRGALPGTPALAWVLTGLPTHPPYARPAAAVVTDDTVYLGFGLDRLADDDVRADLLRRALDHLHR